MTDPNPVHQKIAKIKRLVIQHPQYKAAYTAIVDAYEMRANVGVAQHFVCVGPSGTGKSTLKEMIRKAYPPESLDDREITPVLCVDTPSQPTIRNMAEAMLLQMGEPCFARGSAIDKTNRILNLVKEKKVRLIIFDELQHFIDQGRKKSPQEVSDWLKTLIDKSHASTVLMGLKRSEMILEVNEQLRRRFSRRIELRPFCYEDEDDLANFTSVIMGLDRLLEMNRSMSLDGELIRRWHFATNGIIDYMVRLILGAYEIAINSSRTSIDRGSLERAFKERIWVDGTGNLNPFHDDFEWCRLEGPGMPFNQFQIDSPSRASL